MAQRRIRELAAARKVALTLKAFRELGELGLDEVDACNVLAGLNAPECAGRERSITTGEWMYVFKPNLAGRLLYIKVILRTSCVLISLHEDNDGSYEDNF